MTTPNEQDQQVRGSQRSEQSLNTVAPDPEVVTNHSTLISILLLCAVFVLSLLFIFFICRNFPHINEADKKHFKLPRNIEDAKALGSILSRYKEQHYVVVLSGIMIVYLFLQTFAIPGSIFLSILSGFLFSFPVALLLICFCSATGATFCYGLSWRFGRPLISRFFPNKIRLWSQSVNRQRANLLYYIIFLRITPFLPNWFINIASPVIGVPTYPFWLGTFIGVAPPSLVAIQAGKTLNHLTTTADTFSWTSALVLIALGFLSLLPVVISKFLNRQAT